MSGWAEQVTDPVAEHAEGPVWCPAWGGLRYVDMHRGDLMHLDADGRLTRRHVGTRAVMLRPRLTGGAVVALEHGLALIEDSVDDGPLTELPPVITSSALRLNEGGCDPQGRVYVGSMAYNQTPGAAALYRFATDGSAVVVQDGLTISNGLEWSPDGTLAYHNDTPTGVISVFDHDRERGLINHRPFADAGGNPDGLTVDADGCVWTAIWGGSCVRRFRPDGVLDGEVRLPVSQVSACTFGGADLDELYITTSAEGQEPGQEPLAGSVFVYRPAVSGLPIRPAAI